MIVLVLSNGSFEFNLHQEGNAGSLSQDSCGLHYMFYAEPGHIEVQGKSRFLREQFKSHGTGNNDAFMEFQKIAKEEDFKMGPTIDSVIGLKFWL